MSGQTEPAGDVRLTEDELDLLVALGVLVVAGQTGVGVEVAAVVCGVVAAQGQAEWRSDGHNVWLLAYGHVLVHTTREWLVGHASPRSN